MDMPDVGTNPAQQVYLWFPQHTAMTRQNQLQQWAQQFAIPIANNKPDSGLTIIEDDNGLGLVDSSFPKQQPVRSEWKSEGLDYRLKNATAKTESLLRAVPNKQQPWQVLDATPGLGRDASLLAHAGCHVTMVERSPVVAMLLQDGLHYLAQHNPLLAERLSLIQGNSLDYMNQAALAEGNTIPSKATYDAVYLDPMFPHRKKSALVKKEMQMFQKLLGHDVDADQLLPAALGLAKKRVIVKRPASATELNNQKPETQIRSKKHRFDVYLTYT